MPLHILSAVTGAVPLTQNLVPIVVGVVGAISVRFWAQGRTNDRERDMHGRVVLMTGAFTPIGLNLLTDLAQRGAQIIALTHSLSDLLVQEVIPVIRETTKNELIFAEECDISSPASIRAFCAQLVKPGASGPQLDPMAGPSEPHRLDAIIMTHEYSHIGAAFISPRVDKVPAPPPSRTDPKSKPGITIDTKIKVVVDDSDDGKRIQGSLATFLLTTLILPSLLRAPSDRDIRIINVVNPLYAAAVPTFSPISQPLQAASLWTREGYRSLRAIIFTRHLQRVLDALAEKSQKTDSTSVVPDPEHLSEVVLPDVHYKGSNILSVAVSPGFTRTEPLATALRSTRSSPHYSFFGLLSYIFALPFLLILTKSSRAAIQSILHTLFLPHPLKTRATSDATIGIIGGKLYRDCSAVVLPARGEIDLLDQESVGRGVWEYLEDGVKAWEEKEKKEFEALEAERGDRDDGEPAANDSTGVADDALRRRNGKAKEPVDVL